MHLYIKHGRLVAPSQSLTLDLKPIPKQVLKKTTSSGKLVQVVVLTVLRLRHFSTISPSNEAVHHHALRKLHASLHQHRSSQRQPQKKAALGNLERKSCQIGGLLTIFYRSIIHGPALISIAGQITAWNQWISWEWRELARKTPKLGLIFLMERVHSILDSTKSLERGKSWPFKRYLTELSTAQIHKARWNVSIWSWPTQPYRLAKPTIS